MKYSSIIISALSLFTASVTMTSCSDVLDTAPNGSLTWEEVFSDPVKVSGMLAKCYDKIPQKANTYQNFETLVVALSDDAWSSADATSGVPVTAIYNARHNASSHPLRDTGGIVANGGTAAGAAIGNYWANYWGQIYNINLFLDNIDTAAVNNEEERSRFKAEARLLRAFFYSELVRWFGKLPIIDKVYDFTAQNPYAGMKRESVKDVVDFIIEDCDYAINCNHLPWRITTAAENMRMTKALAWAIKSRMSITAASPLFNEGNDYWEWAYQINKDALDALKANGYELYTECQNTGIYGKGPANAFRELVATKCAFSGKDHETIFQHRINNGHWIWHVGYVGSGENNTAYCGAGPTQELVDAFETTDGEPVLDLEKPYLDDQHLQPNYNPNNTLYDPANPYMYRDPRLEQTVLHNGSKFKWDGREKTVDAYIGGKHEIKSSGRTNTRTGYLPCKLVKPNTDGGSGNVYNDMLPWKFYRLAEIYLNLAEAAAEAGHLPEAREAANKVRNRVQMPELPTTLDQKNTILRIRNERRVELAWEEHRYFDLRRWQKPDGNLKATCAWLTAMYITKNNDGTFTYERKNIWNKERGGAENRDLLLPLSVSEAERLKTNTGVDWQNPGW